MTSLSIWIWICFLSFFGNILIAKCLYVSDQVSDSICKQHQAFAESGELQPSQKSEPASGSRNEPCGWYQVKKGKDAGCASSVVSFIECEIIEQRKSPDFNAQKQAEKLIQESGRIIGGEDAEPHEFPSIVSNRFSGGHICGSTIISPEWIVTAAHCAGKLVLTPTFELIAGQHLLNETDEGNPARQVRKAVAYHDHEKYKSDSFQYDIAVVKVDPPFELNDQVQAVALPDPEYRADGIFTAAGWGKDTSGGELANILQKVQVPFVDDETCSKAYIKYSNGTTEDMLCAGYPEGGKDACQGDSGGPLYIKDDGGKQVLVGIVSYGRGCALPEFPGVYTEVAYFVDWIKKHTCIE